MVALVFAITADTRALTIPIPVEAAITQQSSLVDGATAIAKSRGLNVDHFLKVVGCESGWDPSIQSGYIGPKGREDSWGLVQINLPSHKDITKDQALDPVFSLRYMANEWSRDRYRQWSCYGMMEKQGWPQEFEPSNFLSSSS